MAHIQGEVSLRHFPAEDNDSFQIPTSFSSNLLEDDSFQIANLPPSRRHTRFAVEDSFQIPASSSNPDADYLLNEPDGDFFGGELNSLDTPQPNRTSRHGPNSPSPQPQQGRAPSPPFTLGDITPMAKQRARRTASARTPSRSRSNSRANSPDRPFLPESEPHFPPSFEFRKPNEPSKETQQIPPQEADAAPNSPAKRLANVATAADSPGRFENLKADMDMFMADAAPAVQPSGETTTKAMNIAKPKQRRTVTTGAITKPSKPAPPNAVAGPSRAKSATLPKPTSKSKPQPVASRPFNIADMSIADTDGDVSIVPGGVADRLVQYSQKLMGSFGRSIFTNPSSVPSTSTPPANDSTRSDGADTPLTLSQISPKKGPPTPITTKPSNGAEFMFSTSSSMSRSHSSDIEVIPNPAVVPLASPMRPSVKRSAVSIDCDAERDRNSKKGRTSPSVSGSLTSSSSSSSQVPTTTTVIDAVLAFAGRVSPALRRVGEPRKIRGTAVTHRAGAAVRLASKGKLPVLPVHNGSASHDLGKPGRTDSRQRPIKASSRPGINEQRLRVKPRLPSSITPNPSSSNSAFFGVGRAATMAANSSKASSVIRGGTASSVVSTGTTASTAPTAKGNQGNPVLITDSPRTTKTVIVLQKTAPRKKVALPAPTLFTGARAAAVAKRSLTAVASSSRLVSSTPVTNVSSVVGTIPDAGDDTDESKKDSRKVSTPPRSPIRFSTGSKKARSSPGSSMTLQSTTDRSDRVEPPPTPTPKQKKVADRPAPDSSSTDAEVAPTSLERISDDLVPEKKKSRTPDAATITNSKRKRGDIGHSNPNTMASTAEVTQNSTVSKGKSKEKAQGAMAPPPPPIVTTQDRDPNDCGPLSTTSSSDSVDELGHVGGGPRKKRVAVEDIARTRDGKGNTKPPFSTNAIPSTVSSKGATPNSKPQSKFSSLAARATTTITGHKKNVPAAAATIKSTTNPRPGVGNSTTSNSASSTISKSSTFTFKSTSSVTSTNSGNDPLKSSGVTVPVSFNFSTSTRSKDPSTSTTTTSNLGTSVSHVTPAPDFATIHQSSAQSLALRKQQLMASLPATIPEPIELSTEERARERRKFDDMVKAKEAARIADEEERKKERERLEEEELKEARRRAVVKAHEVPDWYKDRGVGI